MDSTDIETGCQYWVASPQLHKQIRVTTLRRIWRAGGDSWACHTELQTGVVEFDELDFVRPVEARNDHSTVVVAPRTDPLKQSG
jgi:hypothetical protein